MTSSSLIQFIELFPFFRSGTKTCCEVYFGRMSKLITIQTTQNVTTASQYVVTTKTPTLKSRTIIIIQTVCFFFMFTNDNNDMLEVRASNYSNFSFLLQKNYKNLV